VIAETLSSFAIAGHINDCKDFVEKLWRRALDVRLHYKKDELQDLAKFYAAAQIEGANLNLEQPPNSLLEQMEAVTTAAEESTEMNNCKEISDTLTELNIDHKMEVSPFEFGDINFNTSTLNVNIVISARTKENKRVAIEFNGPRHYVQCNGGDVENGKTKFKRRLMEGLGFTVVSIHWDDWRKAREAKTQQVFLFKLIYKSIGLA